MYDNGGKRASSRGSDGVSTYRELIVWQRAMELCRTVCSATKAFPEGERFSLTSQMRRAAVSVASNIAEGQGRLTTKDFVRFLGIARGSLRELETQTLLAADLGFMGEVASARCLELADETGRMLSRLIRRLGKKGGMSSDE